MKEYFISVDLNQSIVAENEKEAYFEAQKMLKDGGFTLQIVDVDAVLE